MDLCDCFYENNAEKMRGFNVFLSLTQLGSLLLMLTAIGTVVFLGSNASLPISIFTYVEVVVFFLALIHACRPSLRMMLFILAIEVINAITMIVLALVLSIRDGNKDCTPAGDNCGIFDLTIDERFYLFWFLLAKATFALFLGLISVAYSPQLHNYMAEDEWEQAIFQA